MRSKKPTDTFWEEANLLRKNKDFKRLYKKKWFRPILNKIIDMVGKPQLANMNYKAVNNILKDSKKLFWIHGEPIIISGPPQKVWKEYTQGVRRAILIVEGPKGLTPNEIGRIGNKAYNNLSWNTNIIWAGRIRKNIKNTKVHLLLIKKEKKRERITKIEEQTRENFPPCIKKILEGELGDGRKRSLFILLNFLKEAGWNKQSIKKEINAWNTRNEPLTRKYVQSQLNQHAKQKETILPPNCNNSMYYKDLGLCNGKQPCAKYKNPANAIRRLLEKAL